MLCKATRTGQDEQSNPPQVDLEHEGSGRKQKPSIPERIRTLRKRKRQAAEDDEESSEDRAPAVTAVEIDPPAGTVLRTLADHEQEVARLRQCLEVCKSERDSAIAHAQLMAKRNHELSNRLHSKKTTRKQKITSGSRFLTSDEAMKQLREEKAVNERKEQEARELKQAQAEKDEKRQRERETKAPTKVWSGAWKSRNKDEVLDLAFALGLAINGTKNEVIERIQTHLSASPWLMRDSRFSGLYPSAPVVTGVSHAVVCLSVLNTHRT